MKFHILPIYASARTVSFLGGRSKRGFSTGDLTGKYVGPVEFHMTEPVRRDSPSGRNDPAVPWTAERVLGAAERSRGYAHGYSTADTPSARWPVTTRRALGSLLGVAR